MDHKNQWFFKRVLSALLIVLLVISDLQPVFAETAYDTQSTIDTYETEAVEETPSEAPEETLSYTEAYLLPKETELYSDTSVLDTAETETETETETEIESETETETETVTKEFVYSDQNIEVKAVITDLERSGIPESAGLTVKALDINSKEYKDAVKQVEDSVVLEEGQYLKLAPYDVYFSMDGEKIEPSDGTVNVEMLFKKDILGVSEEDIVADSFVAHIKEDGNLEQLENTSEELDTVKFDVEEFSIMIPVMVLAAGDSARAASATVYWKYDSASTTLYLRGSSATGYTTVPTNIDAYASQPWASYRANITKINIESAIAPTNTSWWFAGFTKLTSITGIANLSTANDGYMFNMFWNCSSLTSLDLSSFSTANTISFGSMFADCSKLTSINISSFNTAKAVDMGSMFYNCSSLKTIDVSKFSTASASNMDNMFNGCKALTTLNCSNFVTTGIGVTNTAGTMSSMFANCTSLKELDISKFATAGKTCTNMFSGTTNLCLLKTQASGRTDIALPLTMYENNTAKTSYTNMPNGKTIYRKYTVTYYVDGTKQSSTGAKLYSISLTLPTQTSSGATWCGGWYTSSACTGTLYTTYTSNANVTLYSKFTYTLSYNLNGGSVATANPTTYDYLKDEITLNNPSKSGYTFTGWSGTGLTGSANKTVTIAKGSTGNRSYTANYSVNSYTVTYDYATNGGSSATKTSASVQYGASVDLTPAATKANWTFVGWNTNKSATTALTSTTMPAGNITLYAIYKRTLTATFKDYSGTAAATRTASVTIWNSATSGAVTAPTQNTYTGWTSRGWSTATTGNATPSTSYSISANTTYYGLYNRTIKLTYNGNGGSTPTASTGTQYFNSSGNYTNPSVTLPTPTWTGRTFKGWSTSSTASSGSTGSYSFSANQTLYATWQLNAYTITCMDYLTDKTTKIGTPATKSYNYGATAKGSDWGTSSPYNNAQYTYTYNSETSLTVNGAATVYRYWTRAVNSYNVTCEDYIDGTTTKLGTQSAKSYSYGSTAKGSAWGTSSPYNNAQYTYTYKSETSVTVTGATTVKRYWTRTTNSYTVTYNYATNGGTSATKTSATVAYGGSADLTPTATKSGWTFVGWSTSSTSTSKISSHTVTGNVTLYAIYSKSITATFTDYSGTTKGTNTSTSKTIYNTATSASFTVPTERTYTGWTSRGWSTATTGNATPISGTTVTISANTTYYGLYYQSLKLTYNGNGGTTPTAATGTRYFNSYGTTVNPSVTLPTSTRTGYDFKGWNASSTATTGSTGSYSYSANTTLYAIWSLHTYTISYNVNGGNALSGQRTSYNVTSTAYTLPTPTRTGYTFTGWTGTGLSSATKSVSIPQGSTGDRSYTANWSINSYTVTYNYSTNGGTTATKTSASVAYGSAIDLTPTATKSGWTFVGWNTSSTATSKLSSYNMPAGNVTLYAIYSKNVTATFIDYNGTAKRTNSTQTKTIYNTATTATFTAPTQGTYTGWTSKGWSNSTAGNASALSSFSSASNITYYGLYSKTLTLTYNGNGGSTPTAVTGTQYFNSYGNTVNPSTTLATSSRSGYDFKGWNTSSSSSSGSTGSYSFSANTTLYATWAIHNYSITYNLDGGSISGQKTSYTITDSAFTLPTPTKTGYTFTGWTGTGLSSATKTVSVPQGSTGNRAYTATWSINSYTVTYNYATNGGSSSTKTTASVQYGTSVDLTPTATKSGWTFVGWNTSSTAATKLSSYNMPAGNVTLYAIYSKSITATFTDYSGTTKGTNSSSSKTIYNTATSASFTLPTERTYTGWTSRGWSNSTSASATPLTGTTVSASANTTYYGLYSKVLTLTYNGNGGTTPTSATGTQYFNTAGNTANPSITLATSTRSGYTFKGWGTSSSATTGSTGTYSLDASKTLYAVWSKNTYTITYTLNGGSISGQKTSYTVTDSDFTLPTPTKTGNTFTGWTGTGLSSATKSVTVAQGSTGNRTYTANWSVNNYTVTYDYATNGGSSATKSSASVAYNSAIDLSPTATKSGWTFVGWNTDKAAHAGLSSKNMPAGNVTLYAIYSKVLTGTFIDYDTKTETRTVPVTIWNTATSGTITAPTGNICSGWTWRGWSGAGVKTGNASVAYANGATITLSADATFYGLYNQTANVVLSYNANGGSSTPSSQSGVRYWSASSTYANPTFTLASAISRTGYTFEKWHLGSTSGTAYAAGASLSLAANTTVYAGWTPVTYTISYNVNGGNALSGQRTSYTIESDTYTLPTPTRTGYTFSGWTGSNGTTAQASVSIAKGSTGNKTYTANWTPNTYKVTLDKQNGTGGTDAYWYSYEKTYTFNSTSYWYFSSSTIGDSTKLGPLSLVIPTRSGYTFKGYYTGTNSTGTQYVNEKGEFVNNIFRTATNRTLYASWSINTYSISYTLNGGVVTTANPASYNVETATFSLNNPTKTGYTFSGWTGSNGSTPQTSVSIAKGSTGNKTYTANFTASTDTAYKVQHWQQNLGAATTQNSTNYTLKNTDNLTGTTASSVTPATKTYTGFTAPSKQTVTVAADGSTVVNYYYTRNSYTYTLATGTGTTTTGSTASGTYQYGATITLKGVANTGYTWSKWVSSNTGIRANISTASTTFTMPAGDLTMTSTAAANTYTVVYNGNGATSGSTASSSHTYNLAKALTANGYKREYTVTYNANGGSCSSTSATAVSTFNGWSKTASGSKSYSDQQSVSNLTSTNGATVQLYANWTLGSVTLPTPTRTGYIFKGWSTDSSSKSGVTGPYTPGSNVTLYATWEAKQSTVTYNKNDGSNTTAQQTFTYGVTGQAFTDQKWTRTGYTMLGWSDSSTATAKQYATTNGVSDSWINGHSPATTLYAVWKINTYTISYELNGGTVSTANPDTYTVATDTFVLNNPTRTGYTFTGWSESDVPAQETVSVLKGSTGNRSFTANWTENEDTPYKVQHWQQNKDGSASVHDNKNYTLADTDDLQGRTASNVTPGIKTYSGYTSPEPQTVTIAADGSTVVNYYYALTVFNIPVSKQDDHKNPLQDAVLEILDSNKKTLNCIVNGKNVSSWTTSTTDDMLSLTAGTYYLHEKEAPSNYDVADDIQFTVTETGTILINGKLSEKIVMIDQRQTGFICVNNTIDGSMGNKTKSFDFKLKLDDDTITSIRYIASDGKEKELAISNGYFVFKLSHDEQMKFTGIPVGTAYTVSEVNSNAGYTISSVNDSGTVSQNGINVSFTNTKNAVVPTSADTNASIYLLFLLVGISGLFLMFLKRRHKQ